MLIFSYVIKHIIINKNKKIIFFKYLLLTTKKVKKYLYLDFRSII
jgi:hypothetical protein